MRSKWNRDQVVALRADAEVGEWNNAAGVGLLREAERVIQPVIRNTARRHRVRPEEVASATLEAAWHALVRYDPSKSPDPWGWVARAAQRAAVDAAMSVHTGQPARNRARLAAALAATRRRLAGELGREPRPPELVAGLTPGMRTLADRVGVDGDPRAFVAVGAPMLTYDDGILDRSAPSHPQGTTRSCPRLKALAERLADELGLLPCDAEDGVLLAADLLADLIPLAGMNAAAGRVVVELMRSSLSSRRDRQAACRLVDSVVRAVSSHGELPATAA